MGGAIALPAFAGTASASSSRTSFTLEAPTSSSTSTIPSSSRLELRLQLKPNQQALQGYLEELNTPGSPEYHHYLTPAEYAAKYGPSASESRAVQAWASSAGLATSESDGTVTVSGTAGTLDQALGTTLEGSSSATPTAASTSPSLPSGVAADVASIGTVALPSPSPSIVGSSSTTSPAGPQDQATGSSSSTGPSQPAAGGALPSPRPQSESPPSACSLATTAAGQYSPGYTMDLSGSHYGVNSLWSNGDYGQGETIGIYEDASFSMADIQAYEQCMGISASITTVQVDANPNCTGTNCYSSIAQGGNGSIEAELDIEQVITQAPAATVVVYEGNDTNVWAAMVNGVTVNGNTVTVSPDGTAVSTTQDLNTTFSAPNILSISWGWSESGNNDQGAATALEPLFQQAAAEGQTIFAASGDTQSTGVSFPATSPYVTGVGGTDIQTSGADKAWSESTGGYSTRYTEPSWQNVVETSGSGRGVPDISANAGDPQVVLDAGADTNVGYTPEFSAPDVADSGGTTSFTDTGGAITGCSSTSAGGGSYFPCSVSEPSGTDTMNVAYSGYSNGGTNYYASTSQTSFSSSTAPTSTLLVLQGDTLYAWVTPLSEFNWSAQVGINEGGTVAFSDSRGLISGCSSVVVANNGIASCSVPSLSTLDSSANTLFAAYSGDSSYGASQATSTLTAGATSTEVTTLDVAYITSAAAGGPELQAEPHEIQPSNAWPWLGEDGTSAAAPMLAGFYADAADTCTTSFGVAAQGLDNLYSRLGSTVYGSVLTDVTSGSNATLGTSASTGWDPITGLGTPIASGLACPSITHLSETAGYAGDQITVTGTDLSHATFTVGTAAASVVSQSATSAVLTVPSGEGVATVAASMLATGPGVPFTYTEAPAITSAPTADFVAGSSGTFTVSTNGGPYPTITESGSLPTGLSFTDNGNGTATISGTASAAQAGAWPVTVTASNGVGSPAQQNLTVDVGTAPTDTTASAATFLVGSNQSFSLTSTGFPAPTWSVTSGSLPDGLAISGSSITGTTTAAAGSQYSLTLKASNFAGNSSKGLTINIDEAPAFSQQQASQSYTVGQSTNVDVEASGVPTPAISVAPGYSLPDGLSLTDQGTGVGVISGSPSSAGAWTVDIQATSSAGSSIEQLTITSSNPPAAPTTTTSPPPAPTTTTTTAPAPTTTTTTIPPRPKPAIAASFSAKKLKPEQKLTARVTINKTQKTTPTAELEEKTARGWVVLQRLTARRSATLRASFAKAGRYSVRVLVVEGKRTVLTTTATVTVAK